MNSKLIFALFLVIPLVLAKDDHKIAKRQAFQVTDSLVSATNQWTQFIANSWNRLRDNWYNGTDIQSRVDRIHQNISDLRSNLTNATTDAAQQLMARLQNVTHRLNSVLRERAESDRNLVHHLYDMIVNTTRNGTNHSINTLRNAFTSVTQTMAENYSGLANSSLQLASDMMDKGSQLFDSARIRAGNDTHRAILAVSTALNAIRNSSQPINETVQQMAANLSESVLKLSEGVRNLISHNSTATGVQINVNTDFTEKAELSLQKLMSSLNQLKNNLQLFSSNITIDNNNIESNEIDVIQTASKALSRESEELQNQINALRTQREGIRD